MSDSCGLRHHTSTQNQIFEHRIAKALRPQHRKHLRFERVGQLRSLIVAGCGGSGLSFVRGPMGVGRGNSGRSCGGSAGLEVGGEGWVGQLRS